MKVYCEPPQPSLGLQRIRDALVRYAPSWMEIVSTQTEADLIVIYAIGRRDHLLRQTGWLLNRGKQYAIIQVCLRSTMTPDTGDWLEDIWLPAKAIWSYYDLDQACVDDGWSLEHDGDSMFRMGQFYHAPLGVDSSVFYPRNVTKRYIIATSGFNRLQESIRECILAADTVNKDVVHLGREVNWGKNVIGVHGVSDDELASVYSACEFACGLRRTEGFELPAAEGLLCGARPIVFDTLDYRFNYREFAEYINEGTRQQVVDQLVELFQQGPRPVSEVELCEARWWFDWQRIVKGFYDHLR